MAPAPGTAVALAFAALGVTLAAAGLARLVGSGLFFLGVGLLVLGMIVGGLQVLLRNGDTSQEAL
jgi:hypothetical protein